MDLSNFSFTYPSYYIILCVCIGLIFAITHYYKAEKFKEHAKWIRYLLSSLRFLIITTLCLLLMEPILRLFKDKQQDPVIAIFQDASSSLSIGSELNTSDYFAELTRFSASLSTDYKVDQYRFGANIQENFSDSCVAKNTNISKILSFSEQNYANQNLGAIILFSDGIYNSGNHPLYQKTSIKAPVFTVALGDTSARKDVVVKSVLFNPIAYLGDKQNIQIDIEAVNCTSQNIQVSLYQKIGNSNTLINRSPLKINSNNFFRTIEFTVDHHDAGNQSYFIQITELENELSSFNNYKNFFIDVIDGKQNILLVARAPHPRYCCSKENHRCSKKLRYRIGVCCRL